MLRWLWVAVVVIVLDQGTKYAASHLLQYQVPVAVAPGLYLTLTHNAGAAFSFLQTAGGWQRWLFAGLAAVVSVGIVLWLRRLPPGAWWLAMALSLVLGGALGNLWDRLFLGHVVDFIEVYLPFLPWRLFNPWPAFNVADSAISAGAVMLVVDALFHHPEPGPG